MPTNRATSRRLARIFQSGIVCAGAAALALVAAAKPVRVGLEPYEPFSIAGEAGRPTGFAVEVLEAIAAEEKLDLQFELEMWDTVLTKFKAGTIDVLAAVGYTKERAAFIDYSVAHSDLPSAIFVRKGRRDLRTVADLRGKRFAEAKNSLEYAYVVRQGWTENILLLDQVFDPLIALSEGKCDAVVGSRAAVLKFLRDQHLDNIEVAEIALPDLSFALHFGVRKGETELLYQLNRGLARLRANGTYDRLYQKWLGPLEPRPVRLRDTRPFWWPAAAILLLVIAAFYWQRRLLGQLARQAAALRQSEERYRQFFAEDLAGAVFTSADGTIITCNPAFARIFGFGTAADAIGCNMSALYVDSERRGDLLALLRRRPHLQNIELEFRHRDGTPVHVVTNAIGRYDEQGTLLEIKSYVIDHTESKKLEEQLRQSQKMEAVGQLAGGVAHDFNNLLTAILGYSDLLLVELDRDDPKRVSVVEIRNASLRAAALTRQLLAFSRKEIVQPRVLHPNHVVANLEKMLRRLIGEDVTMTLRLDPALGRIRADPGQFEQVIVNLVVNAGDAMPQGGRLSVETANVTLDEQATSGLLNVQPGDYVRLTISDTGCGMKPEVQQRIFEPFFTTKGLGKGTGLGLSMVYGIVKQCGGHIGIDSAPGAGATFKLFFPVATETRPAAGESPPSPAQPRRGVETVLLVEDNEAVRKVTAKILRESGHPVLEANGGPAALQLFAARVADIDLVLTDVIMPGMNGRVLAERIRAAHPAMKVLFMSGYTDDKILQHGGLTAGTVVVQKPFTAEALMRHVRAMLDGAGAP